MARTRITEIGEESRQRILDAAEELFLERGYEKTTLSAIGERCGISYGSIPWHFGNKAGLLYALVVRTFNDPEQGFGLDLQLSLTPGLTGLEQLLAHQSQWDNHPKLPLLHMLDDAFREAPQEMIDELLAVDTKWRERLKVWVSATLDGRNPPGGVTTEGIVHFIISANRGIALARRLDPSTFDHLSARAVYRQSLVAMLLLDCA